MNLNSRFSLPYGLALLPLLPLVFSGCQTSATGPGASPSQSEYTAGVLKLKASGTPNYDQELAKLNARFSLTTPAASVANPAAQASSPQPAAKTAGTLNFQTNFTGTNIAKYVFKATAGAVAMIGADVADINAFNPADPMIFLIQFNDLGFIANGTLSNLGQRSFRIVDFNDDIGGGNVSSYLTHTFNSHEEGYYMWLVLPYSSGNATGKVNLSFDLTNPSCPSCRTDYVFHNPATLGGAVFRNAPGDDFQAMRSGAISNPHLYVFKATASSGMANGDVYSGTLDSRVFALPFGISPWEATNAYNMILIDNDNAGTTMRGVLSVYNN